MNTCCRGGDVRLRMDLATAVLLMLFRYPWIPCTGRNINKHWHEGTMDLSTKGTNEFGLTHLRPFNLTISYSVRQLQNEGPRQNFICTGSRECELSVAPAFRRSRQLILQVRRSNEGLVPFGVGSNVIWRSRSGLLIPRGCLSLYHASPLMLLSDMPLWTES